MQQLPLLLTLIEQPDETLRDSAVEVSRLLVDTLYMKLHGARRTRPRRPIWRVIPRSVT